MNWGRSVSLVSVVACALAWGAGGCGSLPNQTGGRLGGAAMDRRVNSQVRRLIAVPPTEGTGPTQSLGLPGWDKARVRQQTDVWCWAACAEMVHRYGGQPVAQEQIADRILGRAGGNAQPDVVRTAEEAECLAALDPDAYQKAWDRDEAHSRRIAELQERNPDKRVVWQPTRSGGRPAPDLNYDPDQLVADLRARRPVVVGLGIRSEADSEHVVVVHAAEVQQAVRPAVVLPLARPAPAHHIVRATYTDPDTGENRVITGQELAVRADFMATRQRAGEYFRHVAEADFTYSVESLDEDKKGEDENRDDRRRKDRRQRARPQVAGARPGFPGNPAGLPARAAPREAIQQEAIQREAAARNGGRPGSPPAAAVVGHAGVAATPPGVPVQGRAVTASARSLAASPEPKPLPGNQPQRVSSPVGQPATGTKQSPTSPPNRNGSPAQPPVVARPPAVQPATVKPGTAKPAPTAKTAHEKPGGAAAAPKPAATPKPAASPKGSAKPEPSKADVKQTKKPEGKSDKRKDEKPKKSK